MNARQFGAWARPQLTGPDTRARALFLELAGRWWRALGAAAEAHFLESSASSTAPEEVKLALILGDSPARLRARPWRDDDAKTRAGARLLERLAGDGAHHDAGLYARACALLRGWRLRGSLMISCDFDRAASAFGKVTFYGYAPGEGSVAELVSALAAAPPRAAAPAAGSLEFWGLDLWPDGRSALKLYRRAPYRRDALAAVHRPLAAALESVSSVRDLTTLTRVGAQPRAGGRKVYLGLGRGVEASRLRRLPASPQTGRFLSELARRAPGQRVYFFGLGEDGALEAYFDRRQPDDEEQGPLDDL